MSRWGQRTTEHSTIVSVFASRPGCPRFDSQHSPKMQRKKIVNVAKINQRRVRGKWTVAWKCWSISSSWWQVSAIKRAIVEMFSNPSQLLPPSGWCCHLTRTKASQRTVHLGRFRAGIRMNNLGKCKSIKDLTNRVSLSTSRVADMRTTLTPRELVLTNFLTNRLTKSRSSSRSWTSSRMTWVHAVMHLETKAGLISMKWMDWDPAITCRVLQ